MKSVLLSLFLLALCSFGFAAGGSQGAPDPKLETAAAIAQKRAAESASHSPFATSACSFTFTTGSDESFLKYCVTDNGNITQFETPQGHEHIAFGAFSEGYGICDLNSSTAYFDYADSGDSGNWQPATVASQGAKSVKIVRTTSDGVWTLTQTIMQMTGTPSLAVITMSLKNNSPDLRSVRLIRYADVDADGVFGNNFDATSNSAFGWNSFVSAHAFGMVLLNMGNTIFSNGGYSQNVAFGPDPCNPFANTNFTTLSGVDGSIVHFYTIDLKKGATATVKAAYKGL